MGVGAGFGKLGAFAQRASSQAAGLNAGAAAKAANGAAAAAPKQRALLKAPHIVKSRDACRLSITRR